jgi:2-haloacid dehalogenase
MGQTIKAFVFDAYGTLYDVRSVEIAVELAFPGSGRLITHVWRMKQLEYSWLAPLMGRYEDFWCLTLRSLEYTLRSLKLSFNAQLIRDIASGYLNLTPFDDAKRCLERLAPLPLAILSNGTRSMLSRLAANSKLDHLFDHILSVDENRAFAPAPQAYALVEAVLGVGRDEVVFVSSNGFDICGAKSFGFTVVRVARTNTTNIAGSRAETIADDLVVFNMMRANAEALNYAADLTVSSLDDIPDLFRNRGVAG